MISVLLPSRGRPELLKQSIASLGDGNFEVLVWLDDDDIDYPFIHKVTYFRKKRIGYLRFHEMINFLSKKASGDWLMLWNDDATMLTPWVDAILFEDHTEPVVLNFFDPTISINNLFPIISRPMYEAMGHYSLSAHCDSWVQDIANRIGIHKQVWGIRAYHKRDQINDQTKLESQTAYRETSPKHSSPELVGLLEEDIKKIREKQGGTL